MDALVCVHACVGSCVCNIWLCVRSCLSGSVSVQRGTSRPGSLRSVQGTLFTAQRCAPMLANVDGELAAGLLAHGVEELAHSVLHADSSHAA